MAPQTLRDSDGPLADFLSEFVGEVGRKDGRAFDPRRLRHYDQIAWTCTV